MSTYLDQSSTNPDLSSTETPQAPTQEFKLFSRGGGPPKHLDDELLETRDVQHKVGRRNFGDAKCSPKALGRRNFGDARWSTPANEKCGFPPHGLSQRRRDAPERPTCLGEIDVDFLGGEIS